MKLTEFIFVSISVMSLDKKKLLFDYKKTNLKPVYKFRVPDIGNTDKTIIEFGTRK